MRGLFATLVLTLLASGCKQGLPNLGSLKNLSPKVSFKDLKVKDINFNQIDTRMVLRIENPYPVGLKLKSNDWALQLAGQDFLDGSGGGIDIEARDSSPLRIPIAMKWKDVFAVANAVKGQDEIPFALHTDLGFNTPVGEMMIPLDHEGTLPALHTPKVTLKALRMGGLNLARQTASLELDLGVTSEQASAISFDAVRYDISLNGDKAVTGNATMPRIQGAGTLTLPIDLNLRQLGAGVVSAITSKGSLNVGLDASIDVGTPFGVLPLDLNKAKSLRLK